MKSTLTRITLISFLLILFISNSAFTETKTVKESDPVTAYSKAIKINPKDKNAYGERGVAYFRLGKYKLAIADFDKAVQLNPKNALAYYDRAISYNSLGDYNKAIGDLKVAAKLGDKISQDFLKKQKIAW